MRRITVFAPKTLNRTRHDSSLDFKQSRHMLTHINMHVNMHADFLSTAYGRARNFSGVRD